MKQESLEHNFLKQGFVICDVENEKAFEWISDRVFQITKAHVKIKENIESRDLFDNIHNYIQDEHLNSLRLAIIGNLTSDPQFHENYYALATKILHILVGNELAIQKGLGLNIQLPLDQSNLLPIHSDIWGSECSPFEVVLWLPLVDCYRTKSLFILPPDKDRYWRARLHEFTNMEEIFQAVKDDVIWINIKRGQFLLFTHTILHGNRTNNETSTRWSFNVRFKSLFSPYAGKGLGDYFQPLRIKPVTRIGMQFQFPSIKANELKKMDE